jgi:hypothetical protein
MRDNDTVSLVELNILWHMASKSGIKKERTRQLPRTARNENRSGELLSYSQVDDPHIDGKLIMMMLTVESPQLFIDQRHRQKAGTFLSSLAAARARTTPR